MSKTLKEKYKFREEFSNGNSKNEFMNYKVQKSVITLVTIDVKKTCSLTFERKQFYN